MAAIDTTNSTNTYFPGIVSCFDQGTKPPRTGTPSLLLGISDVTMSRITAIVSIVVCPMETFSSRSPETPWGVNIPTLDTVTIKNAGAIMTTK